MARFELDGLYLSLVRDGTARPWLPRHVTERGKRPMTGVPEDIAALEQEFPAWDFGVRWQSANSGSDVRLLLAWPLDGGRTLTALSVEEMRRQIRKQGGAR